MLIQTADEMRFHQGFLRWAMPRVQKGVEGVLAGGREHSRVQLNYPDPKTQEPLSMVVSIQVMPLAKANEFMERVRVELERNKFHMAALRVMLTMDRKKIEEFCRENKVDVPESDEHFWIGVHDMIFNSPVASDADRETSRKYLLEKGRVHV